MKIKKLNEERAAKVAEMRSMVETAKANPEQRMSAEDTEKFNKLDGEIKTIDAELGMLKRAEELMKSTASATRKEETTDGVTAEERAFISILRKSATEEQREALTTANSQVLIPTTIQREVLLGLQGSYSILSAIDLRLTPAAETMVFPYLVGALELMKVEIGSERTNGKVTFKGVSLGAHALKLPTMPISETLLLGADVDVKAALVALFTEYLTRGLSNKIINTGTGNGEPTAFLAKLNKATAEASDALTYNDLVNLKAKVRAPYNQQGRASFLMNSTTKDALLGLVDKQGRPLYIESMSAGVPDRLFGYPIVIDDNMPEIGAGKRALVFGDLKAYKARIVQGAKIKTYDESFYSEQGCIGMQAFITADGKLIYEAGSIEPMAALEMANA